MSDQGHQQTISWATIGQYISVWNEKIILLQVQMLIDIIEFK